MSETLRRAAGSPWWRVERAAADHSPDDAAPDDATPVDPNWLRRSWLITRLLTLLILLPENLILGDVRYYDRNLDALFGATGLPDVLREYPAPALLVFIPPWVVGWGNQIVYVTLFVILMLAIDALFTAALWRSAGRRPAPGVRLWLLIAPCLGPLIFSRFDLVAAALAGAGLLALGAAAVPEARRSVAAGVLVAAGAAVKLWPAALLPALLVVRSTRVRLVAGFAAVGVVAAGGTLAIAGWDRLVSPLTWQGDRGLQIESVFAVPLMWLRVFDPDRWQVAYTNFFAYQVSGPGEDAFVTLSTLATAAALVLLAVLWFRCLRAPGPDAPDRLRLAALLSVLVACLLVLTNKTLSPQYLLWIGALLAAAGCLFPSEPVLGGQIRLLLVACVLTQLIYPIGYHLLTEENWGNAIGALLLTVRNGVLVAMPVLLVRRLLVLTRATAASR